MKTLPAIKNINICNTVIDLTQACVKSYQLDVAYDIKSLYQLVLKGTNEIYWGVRNHGTNMGRINSEHLQYYKNNKYIVLFRLSNLRISDGNIYGDMAMISYTEPYENKWYNKNELNTNWYHADDDYDNFYNESYEIARNFLKNEAED